MSTDERALLDAARAGDRDAIAQLLRAWEPRLYRFGLRMCGDAEAAREVLQETLLAALKGVHHFRGEAALSTWFFALARSFCVRQRRHAHTSLPDAEEKALPDPSALPDVQSHARELGEVLQAALLTLKPEQREVVVLKDVEGLSAEEIAQVLKEDVNAVKSRLHRARVELRTTLRAVLEPQGTSCPALVAELSARPTVDRATCELVEHHVEGCATCQSSADPLRRTVALCRALPGGEVPPAIRAAVRHALGVADSRGA
ncbi:MAG: sigma-70 family RNA polymerase sigma factor [Archangium sp.]